MTRLFKNLMASAAIILFSTATAIAQDCSDVKETKDAFSGETVKKMEQRIGPATWNWQITLQQKGEKYYVGMRIIQGGDIRYVLSKGEKILIKLENGKIVELEMDKDYLPVANVAGTMITSLWLTNSEVDIKTMRRLAKSPITDVRVTIQGVDVALPKIKEKQTANIMAGAGCIAGVVLEK